MAASWFANHSQTSGCDIISDLPSVLYRFLLTRDPRMWVGYM